MRALLRADYRRTIEWLMEDLHEAEDEERMAEQINSRQERYHEFVADIESDRHIRTQTERGPSRSPEAR